MLLRLIEDNEREILQSLRRLTHRQYRLIGGCGRSLASYCHKTNMVSEQDDGYRIVAMLDDELGQRVAQVTIDNQELTDSRLVREALRSELQNYE